MATPHNVPANGEVDKRWSLYIAGKRLRINTLRTHIGISKHKRQTKHSPRNIGGMISMSESKPVPCPNCNVPGTADECQKCNWVKSKQKFAYEA